MENFEAKIVTENIITWIKDWFDNYSGKANGIVLGISGGKDSTIVASLCAKAIGKEKVLGVLMPNDIQKNNDFDDACEVCDIVGIPYRVMDISKIQEKFNDVIRFSKEFKDNEYNDEDLFSLSSHTLTNIAPRIRMTILYTIGQEKKYRVCGTGNLSERYIGYFTKWGDGGCDFNPIANLTSDEVIAIGDYLGLPTHLVHKIPSDGLCGKTDEDNLGFSYKILNNYIRTHTCNNLNVKEKIDNRHNYNIHKVLDIPAFPF